MSTCKQGRDKFQPKAVPCVFLGYPHGNKAYKVMTLGTHKFHFSRDMTFHENVFPLSSPSHSQHMFSLPSALHDHCFAGPEAPLSPPENPLVDIAHDSSLPSQEPISQQVRRSTRSHKAPCYLDDYVCTAHIESHCMTTLTNLIFHPPSLLALCLNLESQQMLHLDLHEPSSFEEAMSHPS